MSQLSQPRMAVISAFLGRTQDRFHEYNEERTLEERLRLAGEMEGIDGVELVYPYEVEGVDPEQLKRLLARYSLGIAAINANIKAEPEFLNGGVSSKNTETREKAVNLIKEAKEYAREAGADKVTCCPLADGYEFAFQSDYTRAWGYLVESFGEAASHLPEIPLFIEYKPSETRGRCFLNSAAKTLCLLNDIGLQRLGITVDFGHSLYGGNNPAEDLALAAESRYPFYVHINDNDARWDWDYFVATKHFLTYVEFLYYLQEHRYSGFITSDTSPTRWDVKETFQANARWTRKIWRLLENLDRQELRKLISGEDYLRTWRFIETEIFSLR